MKKNGIEVKEIRKFAVTMFIAFGVLGGLLLWRKGEIGSIFCAISVIFLALGLSYPKAMYPVYRAWMTFSKILGFAATNVILALVYYLVFTPAGVLMRTFYKSPLNLKIERNLQTYWQHKSRTESSMNKYEKMF